MLQVVKETQVNFSNTYVWKKTFAPGNNNPDKINEKNEKSDCIDNRASIDLIHLRRTQHDFYHIPAKTA